jgi:hypothetical protein
MHIFDEKCASADSCVAVEAGFLSARERAILARGFLRPRES